MCTLTWRRLPDGGFEAFFNRDELKSRMRALPPERFDIAGSAVLMPVDGDAGGTWISVNEHGLGLCLLNFYQGRWVLPDSGAFVSRGLLVRGLSHQPSLAAAGDALRGLDHRDYQPFRLLMLEFGHLPVLYTWDGEQLVSEGAPDAPLISSGLDIETATANRLAEFGRIAGADFAATSSDQLLQFHSSHSPEPSPQSVCMHRPEAHTVSLTRLRIEAGQVSLAYADGSPCQASLGAAVQLERAAATVV